MEEPVSKLIPISPQTHKDLRWRRPSNFHFAAKDHLMPLGLKELRKGAMGLPVGFIKLQDKFMLVAIQGLRNGENLIVDDSGDWLAVHAPQAYIGYPLRMSRLDEERFQVCVAEESEFVCKAEDVPEEAKGWHHFFDDEGKLDSEVAELVTQMQQHAADLAAAERATVKLAELEMIKEWEIKAGPEESPVLVQGLYAIDQSQLGDLDGDTLLAMRDCGALYLTYAQTMSGYHISALGRLARKRWKQPEESTESELEFEKDGNISFENL